MRLPITPPAILIAALPLAAQQPIVTDRPDFTESAVTVPPGRLQIEGGYTLTRDGGVREHALGELLVRVPVATGLELRLGVNSYVWTRGPGADAAGFEDAALGLKVALAEGSERFDPMRPAIALLAATALPTGAEAYRERNLQPEAKLAVAWTLSERLGLASNLNYAYASEEDRRFNQLSGSLSLGYALGVRWGSYLEAYGFVPGTRQGPDAAFLNGGLTFLLSDDVQLDARAGVGLNEAPSDSFFGLGISLRW